MKISHLRKVGNIRFYKQSINKWIKFGFEIKLKKLT